MLSAAPFANLFPSSVDSNPASYTAANGLVFFTADDGIHGRELWKTDGTRAGTSMVADLWPGVNSSNPANLIAVGNRLLFSASNGVVGNELYETDGTAAGTQPVHDIGGRIASINRPGVVAGNYAYFGDSLLIRTDGTPAGTVFLGSPNIPGAVPVIPALPMYVVGSEVYFAGNDVTHGQELWRTDGTLAGTTMVADIAPGVGWSSPMDVVSLNNKIYYIASSSGSGQEIYVSDGTPAGTSLVKAFPNGIHSDLTVIGSSLYLAADDGHHGVEPWKSDGTPAGTVLLDDVNPSGDSYPGPFAGAGNLVYFPAMLNGYGREMWVTNGTTAGTHMVANIDPGTDQYSGAFDVWETQGRPVWYETNALWTSDGTSVGTKALAVNDAGIPQTIDTSTFQVVNDTLWFQAADGWWSTDGTQAGTRLVSRYIPPTAPRTANGKLVFTSNAGIAGAEPWFSSGTDADAQLLVDVNRIFQDSQGSVLATMSSAGNRLYFDAIGDAGQYLYESDGSLAGTYPVPGLPLNVLSDGKGVDVGGNLVFASTDGNLWKTDGTAAGTVELAAFTTPPAITSLISYGTLGYFLATTSTGRSLWRTDGTASGTFPLCTFLGTGAATYIGQLGSYMYFANYDIPHAWELWRTDGTPNGTAIFDDLNPGPGDGLPKGAALATAAGNKLYFTGYNGVWATDGTAAGTLRVNSVSGVARMWGFQNQGYFSANGQFWRSDGTVAGTVEWDTVPMNTGDPTTGPVVLGNAFYFVATTGANGSEIWRSDGTAAGTGLQLELVPGPNGSAPGQFALANNMLLFTATNWTQSGVWHTDGTPQHTALDAQMDFNTYLDGYVPLNGSVLFFESSIADRASGESLWKWTPITADAGGPYTATEGATIPLHATASADVADSISSYEWDFNYNGKTFTADATGADATFSAAGQFAPGTVTVALRVTDSLGNVVIVTAPVTIADAPPTANFVGQDVLQGNSSTVTFQNPVDPYPRNGVSSFLYSYDFDNNGVFEISNAISPAEVVPSAYLSTPGLHTVHGRIQNVSGGYTDYTTVINVLLPVSVSGYVYGDSNADGSWETGESHAAGVLVYLDANSNGTLDAGESSTASDSAGNYSFSNVFPGSYAVRLKLPSGWTQTDSSSQISFQLGSGTQVSDMDFGVQSPPLASLGGPYSVPEGGSVALSAAASSEVGGSIATYEWDTNYNGSTFVARATGVTTSFSAVGLDGPSTRNIALRITDSRGATSIATGSVSIANASPTAIFLSGGAVTLGSAGSVSFTNPADTAPADVAAGFKYSYDFNNDGTFDTVDSASSTASVPASYLSTAGLHTIKGRIKDKDGGFTDYTTSIQVNAASTGTITGAVFNDANGNGVKDSGETTGVSGQKFFLDLNRNSILDAGEPSFTTASNGAFTFSGPAAGTYRVRMTQLTGWKWTAPTSGYYEVTVAAGQTVATKNYLEHKTAALSASISPSAALATGTISGVVFNDANGNGKRDGGEASLSGWVVYLDLNNDGKLDAGDVSFTTGADGKYSFVVRAGTYRVRQAMRKGYSSTTPPSGIDVTAGGAFHRDFGDR